MSRNVTIKEPGYVYIYISNEGSVQQDIYFDDMTITHQKSKVVQANDYYPFGLTFNSYSRENSVEQKYQYNGMEMQDELGLGWLDYGARMYMSDIGRWGVIDPLSEVSRRWSPYTYAYDNPIRFIDPDGMLATDVNEDDKPKHEVVSTSFNKKEGTVTITEKYTSSTSTTTTKTNDDGTITKTTQASQSVTTTTATINSDGEIINTESTTTKTAFDIVETTSDTGKSLGIEIRPVSFEQNNNPVRGEEALRAQGIIATGLGVGTYRMDVDGTSAAIEGAKLLRRGSEEKFDKAFQRGLERGINAMTKERAKSAIRK